MLPLQPKLLRSRELLHTLKTHSDVTTLQTSFRPFSFSSDFMASVDTISFLPLKFRRIKVTVKEKLQNISIMSGEFIVSLLILHTKKYKFADFLYTNISANSNDTQTIIQSRRLGLHFQPTTFSRNSCLRFVTDD